MSKKSVEVMSATFTKPTRLPKKLSKPEKKRLKKFETKTSQPPMVVCESVGNILVKITSLYHKPLSVPNLRNMMDILWAKADEVSEAVGDNWFPCGFANLWVESRSTLVKLFKKEGYKDRQGNYRIDGIGYISKSYDTGYSVHLELPSRNATESQSLNYKTPLYNLAQKMLAFMGVSVQVRTMVD